MQILMQRNGNLGIVNVVTDAALQLEYCNIVILRKIPYTVHKTFKAAVLQYWFDE